MLLYNNRLSGNCYKVRLLFAHLGLDYEIRELDVFDRSDRPEVLGELNPSLRVPTLVLDDGRSLGESGAILEVSGGRADRWSIITIPPGATGAGPPGQPAEPP